MNEIKSRFLYIESEHKKLSSFDSIYLTECIILQLRKILELIAFASISPNKDEYIKLRKSQKHPDYRKDFHAKRILDTISKVNSRFYPEPFIIKPQMKFEAGKQLKQVVPFDGDYLNKKKFENLYDRLGKYLHADNPLGNDKGFENFKHDIPVFIEQIRCLLRQHLVVISEAKACNLWMVTMGSNNESVQMVIAESQAI